MGTVKAVEGYRPVRPFRHFSPAIAAVGDRLGCVGREAKNGNIERDLNVKVVEQTQSRGWSLSPFLVRLVSRFGVLPKPYIHFSTVRCWIHFRKVEANAHCRV